MYKHIHTHFWKIVGGVLVQLSYTPCTPRRPGRCHKKPFKKGFDNDLTSSPATTCRPWRYLSPTAYQERRSGGEVVPPLDHNPPWVLRHPKRTALLLLLTTTWKLLRSRPDRLNLKKKKKKKVPTGSMCSHLKQKTVTSGIRPNRPIANEPA